MKFQYSPKTDQNTLQSAFTLLETLAAIFVITVAVVGFFALFARLTSTTTFSSSKLTAVYLAQEGVEIVRNIRDTNYLDYLGGANWDDNLLPGEHGGDYTSQQIPDPNPNCDNKNLKFDGSFYRCTSDATKFKRKILITKDYLDGDEKYDRINVEVIVEWQEKGSHQISVKEQLYNWLSQ